MSCRNVRFALVLSAALLGAGCGDSDPTAPELLAPANVTVTANGPRSVTVSFVAVSGAASYVIERGESSSSGAVTFTQAGSSAATTYTDDAVLPARAYQYRVAAVTGTRQSNFSSAVGVTTPADGPKVAIISVDILSNRTLYADTVYTLRGFIHVANGATLTIQPGTRIVGDYDVVGSSLFVMRGAKLMACGTAQAPIVFTSSRPVGQRRPGDWGGLILVGNARINRAADTQLEGTGGTPSNPAIIYGGGTNDADSSGELCYVRVEFAGYAISTNNELNSFTFAAVGSGTKLEYLQAMSGLDDHFEWFGGTVDAKYLVSYESGDDHFDSAEGYRGRVQFMIAYQSKVLDPRTGAGAVSSDPQGIENDGCNPCVADGENSQPYNQPLWANFTLIGTGSGVVDATSGGHAMVLRRGTGGYYVNGVVARWPRSALSLRDATTTNRYAAGDLAVMNVLGVEVGSLLHAGQQAYDTVSNSLRSSAGSAASLFNLLPTDPSSAAQFDWAPSPASAARSGGLTTFPAQIAAKAGTFVTPTSYRGAVDPNGPRWWDGWTIYADN